MQDDEEQYDESQPAYQEGMREPIAQDVHMARRLGRESRGQRNP